MAVSDGFYRSTGNGNFRNYALLSGQTVTAADAIQFDETGSIRRAATNVEVLGVALNGASSGTGPLLIDMCRSCDEFSCKVSTGTMATAEIGEEADFEDEDSITLTESNNDVLIVGWDRANTDQAYVVFKNLVYGA